MPFDLTHLVPIYQENIDQIILQLGKPVILYFSESVTPVSSGFFDPLRVENTLMPDFKQTAANPAPIRTTSTRTILALLKWKPKEYEHFDDQRVDNPDGILRLKTFLTDIPDLMRCEYIVPNANSVPIISTKYKLVRQPQPVGLQIDRYAISYWDMFA